MGSYFKLSVAVLLPALAAAILYVLDRETSFKKWNKWVKQLIYGIVFGSLAIIGTEWGIPMNGAQVNCRDAAVLVAGLLFGAPAGIIAGLIGGIERWIAVAWGIGTYTRVACTVSTIIAGFYAAALRKWMFENKKPGLWISLEIGIVMEVFHLTMVFVTNMDTIEKAVEVVKACTAPMIIGNGISVMLSVFLLSLIGKERIRSIRKVEQDEIRITQTIQRWLLVAVTFAFLLTSIFIYQLQTRASETQTDNVLTLALEGTAADINATSDANLLGITRNISREIAVGDPYTIAKKYQVAEISLIDKNGIIYKSNVPEYIGFDMHTGEQSEAFLCLLGDETEYVQPYGPIARDPNMQRKYAGIKTAKGFLQVGYDAEQFQKDLDEEVIGFTEYRHVGQSGYILIVDAQFKPVSMPVGISTDALAEMGADIEKAGPDVTVATKINGEDVFCRYRNVEGYYLISVLPVKEVWRTRDIAVYINGFIEIMIFALLFALIYMLVKRVVVSQIDRINHSLDKITNGNLNEVVNVRSNKEFASLSDDINQTVDTLKRYIEEASARIDAELELAKNIQLSVLPNNFPAFPKRRDFDIYAQTNPAKEVGGDFYDLYMTGENTLHFLIADVSGKGIPAAMFMMRAKTQLKGLTESGTPINDVFTLGNKALCEGNDAEMFVTAWQGKIDLENGTVSYVNAGHNPPLICHNGRFEFLYSRAGFVLAGMEGIRYRAQELKLDPGDIILLYTDGIPEAINAEGEFYGNDRLLEVINSRKFDTMKELCDFVKADVDAFAGEAPQFDDITMLALHYTGAAPEPTLVIEEACTEDVVKVTEFVEEALNELECSMKTIIQINVAIDEVFSNIVKYGYPEAPGPIKVSVKGLDDPTRVVVRFEDEGIPYNPLLKEDPDVTLSAEERSIGGLGIYMVKKTMDNVRYMYENGHNILTIEKKYS